jgi:hypothetical protein
MKRYYDQHRADSRSYKPGDLVLLEGSNLTTIRPSKKLDHKHFGPFEILSKVGTAAYKLKLPRTWKTVWPVFNEVLLTPYTPLQFETQQQIINSRLVRGKLRYLVHWKGYEMHEQTWEPPSNLKNASNAIQDFHRYESLIY